MKSLICVAVAGIGLLIPGQRLLGQEGADRPSPEVVLDLNEGIHQYLQGHLDEREYRFYKSTIDRMTGVLERDADNRTALLFRALSYGRIGLLERGKRLGAQDQIEITRETLRIRQNPEEQAAIGREIEELTAKLQDESLSPSDRLLLKTEKRRLEDLQAWLELQSEASTEQLQNDIEANRQEMRAAARRERAAYSAMIEDLERLNEVLARTDVVVGLLDVVARSKIARLDQNEARDIRAAELPPEQITESAEGLRARAEEALEQTARTLEELLQRDLSTEDAVRARFFLGVIRYRQAVPRRAPDEDVDVDEVRLANSARIMRDLSNDPSAPDQWRSYASLYLGLILPIQALIETDSGARDELLDEAESSLDQAVKLDTVVPAPGEEPFSLSGGPIPEIALRQREEVIAKVREQPQLLGYQNDVRFSFFIGPNYDTNVVLLGERTDLPRGIDDESDFGLALGVAVDYTLNLGHIDPSYDRWTIGLRGRTTQLWHCEVDEFDEQTYGFTGAVQYELMRKSGDVGPVYLRVQYDYSWTNLGRESFLGSNLFRPDIRVNWDDRLAESALYFEYDNRDYFEPLVDRRFDRTGEYFRFGLMHSHKLKDMTPWFEEKGWEPWGLASDEGQLQDDPDYPARYFTPFIGIEYGWDSTNGDEFDQNNYTLAAGFILPLPWGLQFDFAAEFEWEDYRHGSLVDFHRRGRDDFIQEYEIGLQRTFVLQNGELVNRYTPTIDRSLMTVRAHARWTDDDSNVVDRLGSAVYSYDRGFYGITFAFAFN